MEGIVAKGNHIYFEGITSCSLPDQLTDHRHKLLTTLVGEGHPGTEAGSNPCLLSPSTGLN